MDGAKYLIGLDDNEIRDIASALWFYSKVGKLSVGHQKDVLRLLKKVRNKYVM